MRDACRSAVDAARERGIAAPLAHATGLSGLGALEVRGPDARAWLHTCVSNDVLGLTPGDGNLSARLDRTGRLQHWFAVHALEPDRLWVVLPRDEIEPLRADLDAYLFAEQVTLEDVTDRYRWLAVLGPRSPEPLAAALGLDQHALASLAEAACLPTEGGGWVMRRALTGDLGYLVALDGADPARLDDALAAAGRAGLTVLDAATLSDAVEVMRIEAGWPRVGPDTAGPKRPLLPELGLEQHAVSYTKGCYLGQEVIARVRTYGSLPRALRALVLSRDTALPEPGAAIERSEGGSVGRWLSRTWSPAREAPVALATLTREHRTPGTRLTLLAADGPVDATVALLPLHRADDPSSRAQQLYERAVAVFATGDEAAALSLLQDALRADPSHADTYEAIGVVLGRAGRFHEAIDFFRRLEELAPHEPMVNTNLSLYYMKLGDKATAEAEAARALQKSMRAGDDAGRDAAEVAREAEAARLADARRKREMFAMVLEIDPDDPVALYGSGNACAALGDWAQARAHYAHAAEVQRDNSAVWLGLGKALEALDRADEAIEAYRQGVEVASRRGDLMPLKEMEQRALLLGAARGGP